MQVKIMVGVDSQQVVEHVREVNRTLAQMEEHATALGREVARKTLQATVSPVPTPRPLFAGRKLWFENWEISVKTGEFGGLR